MTSSGSSSSSWACCTPVVLAVPTFLAAGRSHEAAHGRRGGGRPRLSRDQVYLLVKRGELAGVRIGRSVRVDWATSSASSSCEGWLTMRGHRQGSLCRRGNNGLWVARVSLPDGTRRTATSMDKRVAQAELERLLRETGQGVRRTKRLSVAACLRWWLADAVDTSSLAPEDEGGLPRHRREPPRAALRRLPRRAPHGRRHQRRPDPLRDVGAHQEPPPRRAPRGLPVGRSATASSPRTRPGAQGCRRPGAARP